MEECEVIWNKLQQVVDGELPDEEIEALLRRFDECRKVRECFRCTRALEGIRRVKAAVAAARATGAPSRLRDAIRSSLADEETGESGSEA